MPGIWMPFRGRKQNNKHGATGSVQPDAGAQAAHGLGMAPSEPHGHGGSQAGSVSPPHIPMGPQVDLHRLESGGKHGSTQKNSYAHTGAGTDAGPPPPPHVQWGPQSDLDRLKSGGQHGSTQKNSYAHTGAGTDAGLPPVHVSMGPQEDLKRLESRGKDYAPTTATQGMPSAYHEKTGDILKQEKVFSYNGHTNVVKDTFADGRVVYHDQNGAIIGTDTAPAGRTAVTPTGHGSGGTPAGNTPVVPIAHPGGSPTGHTPSAPTGHLSTTTPTTSETFKVPDWAKGMPGWKPGDIPVTATSTDPKGQNGIIGYQDPKGDWVTQTPSGAWVERPAGKDDSYLVKKAPDAAPGGVAAAPHDLPLGPNPVSENTGLGSGNINNRSVAPSGNGQGATSVPDWHADIAPNLGGIGGDALKQHGDALAVRDSKDGTKEIAQMKDGSYQSIDKLTGAVKSAGTWGDGQGHGVNPKTGIGNPAATTTTTTTTTTTDTTTDPMALVSGSYTPPTSSSTTVAGAAYISPVKSSPNEVSTANGLGGLGVDTGVHGPASRPGRMGHRLETD